MTRSAPVLGKQVIWHNVMISRADRNCLNNHLSGLVWLTGLSAAGKSTIAHAAEKELFSRGVRTYVLDGDNVRLGLNSDLGFSSEDRKENIRRIAEVSKLMVDAGLLVLACFISPSRDDREAVRKLFKGDNYAEVYVQCSPEECERRDPKGQYKRARAGIIENYTGVSAPYEKPLVPEFVLDTEKMTIEEAKDALIEFIFKKNMLGTQNGRESCGG